MRLLRKRRILVDKAASEHRPIQRGYEYTILWTSPSYYIAASIRALAEGAAGPSIVYFEPQGLQTAYDADLFDFGSTEVRDYNDPELEGSIKAARVVVLCGWHRKRLLWSVLTRAQGVRILFFDNPWYGGARQRLAAPVLRALLHPNFHGVFVPGEAQAKYARLLGFSRGQIATGGYSADVERKEARGDHDSAGFLTIARLVEEKGIPELLSGYATYRRSVSDPLPLRIAGVGPLRHMLEGQPGVEHLGFLQQHEVSSALRSAGAFVLASRLEHWGVVVHEAAAAGLPLLLSEAVTSREVFLDGFGNGRVFRTRSSTDIAETLRWFHESSVEDRNRMGLRSVELSRRQSPTFWADSLARLADLCGVRGTTRPRRRGD
jgi:glycosyltransferase involved in cell wall biosynthesis